MNTLRIATRKSPLALWQAEHVGALLRKKFPDVEIALLPMTTEGDKLLDAPLANVGDLHGYVFQRVHGDIGIPAE